MFHLLRAHPDDDRVAIDAKGYAGEAYWGRFFWDTEIYLLPFYLYTDPARARSLVNFRVRTLGGALANAARYGYRGAKYAWESDAQGAECCPNFQYADHEIHISADVVYGMAHYAAAADGDYLRGPAARALVETARYWLDRIDRRADDKYLSLLGVMGPDEYTPISNNNAYTNRLASHALELAARVGGAAGAGEDECRAFAAASAQLFQPRANDGLLVPQCEEFARLAEPRFDKLWPDRTRPFSTQVSQERLYRSKCLKQADVLMLPLLFPHEWTPDMLRRNWDYYQPCTTHDSSLSPGVHAIVALELGLHDEAWDFWRRASQLDLNVAHGGAAEGIHIAGAGATWMVATLGFAGLRTALHASALTLRPRLPRAWTRLSFPLVWKGCRAFVDLTHTTARVENRGEHALSAAVHDDARTIARGASELWRLSR
jgi:kojibiose phosphorylase